MIQEQKIFSERLRTRIFEYRSPLNISKDGDTIFYSLIYIYLYSSQYDSDTIKYFPPTYPGKWILGCHKIHGPNEHCPNPAITLKLERNIKTEIFIPIHLKADKKNFIAVLTKSTNISRNSSGYPLYFVKYHYPYKWANGNQPIYLEHIDSTEAEYDYTIKRNTELVEHNLDKPLMEGDRIQMFCMSSHTLYSGGAYITILWENGTELMPPEEMNVYYTDVNFSEDSKQFQRNLFKWDEYEDEYFMLYFLTKEIPVNSGMKQVNCYMPGWTDGKWDKVSRKIAVVRK